MDCCQAKAVLSDVDILNERTNGHIIIDPFNKNNLANGSYDVRLGEYYYRVNPSIKILNPWNEHQIKEYWMGPNVAEVVEENNAENLGLKKGDKFIKIKPGELILAHTEEFIGGKDHIITMMKTRSSLMRSCICTCVFIFLH